MELEAYPWVSNNPPELESFLGIPFLNIPLLDLLRQLSGSPVFVRRPLLAPRDPERRAVRVTHFYAEHRGGHRGGLGWGGQPRHVMNFPWASLRPSRAACSLGDSEGDWSGTNQMEVGGWWFLKRRNSAAVPGGWWGTCSFLQEPRVGFVCRMVELPLKLILEGGAISPFSSKFTLPLSW